MRSRHELAAYLSRCGASDVHVEEVLADLARLGHVDDDAFARAFTRDRVRLSPRGYRLIEKELTDRGVSRGAAANAVRAVEEDEPEVEVARRYVERRRRRLASVEPDRLDATVSGWLMRRGFRGDTAREVVRALEDEAENEAENEEER